MTKADDKTVAAVRSEMESTAEIPQLKKTVGRDGRSRSKPAKMGSRTKKPPPMLEGHIEGGIVHVDVTPSRSSAPTAEIPATIAVEIPTTTESAPQTEPPPIRDIQNFMMRFQAKVFTWLKTPSSDDDRAELVEAIHTVANGLTMLAQSVAERPADAVLQ